MKDLLQTIIHYIPAYLAEFLSLISGPKQFINRKNLQELEGLHDALLFMGLSLALAFILSLPLHPPEKDLWTYLGVFAAAIFVAVILSAIGLRFAWFLVGGKAPLMSFVIIYAYYAGVIMLIFAIFMIASQGVIKAYDPDLYSQLLEITKMDRTQSESALENIDVYSNKIFIIANLVNGAGDLVAGIWFFIGWGAFRESNNLSKVRSFFAAMIVIAMYIPSQWMGTVLSAMLLR